jgi:hypothetical protein
MPRDSAQTPFLEIAFTIRGHVELCRISATIRNRLRHLWRATRGAPGKRAELARSADRLSSGTPSRNKPIAASNWVQGQVQ